MSALPWFDAPGRSLPSGGDIRPDKYVAGRLNVDDPNAVEDLGVVTIHDYRGIDAMDRSRLKIKHPLKPYLLDPNSSMMMTWDVFIIACLLYTYWIDVARVPLRRYPEAVWTPFEVAFLGTDSLTIEVDALFLVNRVVDFAFVLDMLFAFLLPYTRSDGKLVDDPGKIFAHYVRGWFLVDVVSVVPYDMLAVMLQSVEAGRFRILRIIRLFRLAKLLTVLRTGRIVQRWQATNEVNYSVLALYKFGLSILFLAHWMACLFYMVAATEDRRVNWASTYFNVYEKNVQPDGTVKDVDNGSLYVASVYWAVATLSTLGYGDVVPESNAERLYSVVCTFIGGAVYAYLLGSVCSIITNLDESSNTYFRHLDELNKFMAEKGLPRELRIKLRDYFRFRRNCRAMVEWSSVMHLMSDSLRLEVAENVFGGWIRAMPILKDCPRRLPAMLSAHLSSMVLGPHEDLMANPTTLRCLFIIEKGLVAHRGAILEMGALLGVERIYAPEPSSSSSSSSSTSSASLPAITVCHSVVLCLDRNALLKVVSQFPKVQQTMRRVVVRIVFRKAMIAYARCVLNSVKSKSGGFDALNRLGAEGNPRLMEIAECHRTRLMRRLDPAHFDAVEASAVTVQRFYRGALVRKRMRNIRRTQESSTSDGQALYHLLLDLKLSRFVDVAASLKLEKKTLRVLSVSELCHLTGMPFADAARVILAVTEEDRARGGGGGGGGGGTQGVHYEQTVRGGGGGPPADSLARLESSLGALVRRVDSLGEQLRAFHSAAGHDAAAAAGASSSSAESGAVLARHFRDVKGTVASLEAKLDEVLPSLSQMVSQVVSAHLQQHLRQQQEQHLLQLQYQQPPRLQQGGGQSLANSPGSPAGLWGGGGGGGGGGNGEGEYSYGGGGGGGGRDGFVAESPTFSSPTKHQPWTSGVPPTPGTEARARGGVGARGGGGGGGGGLDTDEISLVPDSAAVFAAKAFTGGGGRGGGGGGGLGAWASAEEVGAPRGGRSDVGLTVLMAVSKFREAASKARGGTPKR